MNKEELKKIIVEKLSILNVVNVSFYLETVADNIVTEILPEDDLLIKIIDKEQEFWD